jgi:hypothetical protein
MNRIYITIVTIAILAIGAAQSFADSGISISYRSMPACKYSPGERMGRVQFQQEL